MELFFIIITLIYFLIHLYLLSGLNKSLAIKSDAKMELPFISVIVAARNEKDNIVKCIESLSKLAYPDRLFEIILVNDNSTDNTLGLMTNAVKDFPQFKVINSRKYTSDNLKGKANAIDTAIEICKGEIIISTDADCEVNSDWLINTVKYFSEKTGMVCGFTIIKSESSFFAKLQCIDWIYLQTLASSSSGLNLIISCIGNNLSFRKAVYEMVGGYKSINFSVTEDLALMRKINSGKEFKIVYPVNKECVVKTLPCQNVSELMSQKRRWFRGGTDVNFFGYIIGTELYLINILLIFGLFIISYKLYLLLIIFKILSELILIYKVLNKFGQLSLLKYYPLFIFYFAAVGLILPWSFLSGRNINWKGRKL